MFPSCLFIIVLGLVFVYPWEVTMVPFRELDYPREVIIVSFREWDYAWEAIMLSFREWYFLAALIKGKSNITEFYQIVIVTELYNYSV